MMVKRVPKSTPQAGKAGPRRGASDAKLANVIARTELMLAASEVIAKREWTQSEAATFLGVGQPRISDLMQGRIDRFTVDMLLNWLQKLGKDVNLSIQSGIFGTEDKVELALYVCGQVEQRLLDNVSELFGSDDTRYSLKVVNVLEQPSLAARERITATPSLVKESPPPRIVLTGDLSRASTRWQLSIMEQGMLDNRDAAQDLRQAAQDHRDVRLSQLEDSMKERKKDREKDRD
jgi:predicted XRE-type DNA-binding protein